MKGCLQSAHFLKDCNAGFQLVAVEPGNPEITIDLDEAAKDWLGKRGYDPAYGARPLKRVIQKFVQDPLAEQLLEGTIHDGERVEITADKDGLLFNGKAAKAAA